MIPPTENRVKTQQGDLLTPWIVLWSMLAFTVLASWFVASYSKRSERSLFERQAEVVALQVGYRLETYVALLRAGASHFAASQDVTPTDFHHFVQRLRIDEAYPGIQGVGYSAVIPADQYDEKMALYRERLAMPDFKVWPLGPGQEMHAIIYLEPKGVRNNAAVGYNMHSDPVRRAAMDSARDTGTPEASSRVTLVQELNDTVKQPGFLIYAPVYGNVTDVPASPEERHMELNGFFYGAFRANDFFQSCLRQMGISGIGLRVFDGENESVSSELFASEQKESPLRARYHARRQIEVAGQTWTLLFDGDTDLGLAGPRVIVPLVAATGIAVALLLFGVTRSAAMANAAAFRSAMEAAHSKRLFERIAEATPDILYVHDLMNQRNVFVNRALATTLGYSPEDLREMKTDWVFRMIHPDDQPELFRYIARLTDLQDGEVRNIEVRARGVDGAYRWFFTRDLVFRRTPDGQVAEVLGVAIDVTERRQSEETVRLANKAKDDFLAALSHELRTPLTPVLAIISSLETDSKMTADHREELRMARRNVELEARLIDDLLDLTRIVRGKLVLNLEPVDMCDLAEHTAASVRELKDKEIEFAIHWDASERWVFGDRSRLTQLLWNLIKNAAKFTTAGKRVTLSARNEDGAVAGTTWLAVEVVDQGIGIDSAALPKIFNAFEQGGMTVTRRYGGLGLGLAISKAVAEMHHGHISASSDGAGRGARFRVLLPTIPAPAAEELLILPSMTGSNGETERSAGARLLFVEDHADTAVILAKHLRRIGYHVVHACSVKEALEAVRQAHEADLSFDLVVSDLGLPDGTGYDLMQQLAESYGLRGIALSGFGMEADVRRSEQAGFLRHLIKPVDFQLLQRVLIEALAAAASPSV